MTKVSKIKVSETKKDKKADMKLQSIPITYEKPSINILSVGIIGNGSMLMAKFSDRTKQKMIDAQNGIKPANKSEKIPVPALFEEASYIIGKTKDTKKPILGFPASGFVGAIINAVRLHPNKKLKMSGMSQAISIDIDKSISEDLIPFTGYTEWKVRTDRISTGMGGSQIAVRAEVSGWKTKLNIVYDPNYVDHNELLQLLDIAGRSVGIGAWRPTNNGTFGKFYVDDSDIRLFSIKSR